MKKILLLFMIPFLPILIILIAIAGSESTTTAFTPQTEQEKVAYQVYTYVLENGGTKEFACAW